MSPLFNGRLIVKPYLTFCAAFASTALATPASAATFTVNAHEVLSGVHSFWTASTTFSLPTGFSNAVLHITDFGIDDRGTVSLNGTVIDSVGLFAPGNGFLVSTLGGPNTPHFYAIGDGARNVFVTSGFVTGANQLLFTGNDTGAGIFGDLTGGPFGTAGGAYAFNAVLSYDVAAVPEPASWALMILGFGVAGSVLRKTNRRHTQASHALLA
jgi:PEP-CTERM motif